MLLRWCSLFACIEKFCLKHQQNHVVILFHQQHLKWPMNTLLPTPAQVHRERKCQVNKWTCWMPMHRPKQYLWFLSGRLLVIFPCWKVEKSRISWSVSISNQDWFANVVTAGKYGHVLHLVGILNNNPNKEWGMICFCWCC